MCARRLAQRAQCPPWIAGTSHAFDLIPAVQVLARARMPLACLPASPRDSSPSDCPCPAPPLFAKRTVAAIWYTQAVVQGKLAVGRVRALLMKQLCSELSPLFVDADQHRSASFLCQLDANFEVPSSCRRTQRERALRRRRRLSSR